MLKVMSFSAEYACCVGLKPLRWFLGERTRPRMCRYVPVREKGEYFPPYRGVAPDPHSRLIGMSELARLSAA